ncbi:MAG: ABC-F family ATP-binding cassette domain-containing protein [Acidimicrobiales bacterium]
MLSLSRISKAHGARVLFRDLTLQIRGGRRIALVGGNGVGKTTLLEILLGIQPPDSGEVIRPAGTRVGYLPQDLATEQRGTVLEEALRGAEHITEIAEELHRLEAAMADVGHPDHAKAIDRYGEAQSRFQQLGGYAIEAEAHRVLAGLGFSSEASGKAVTELSGGWRMRLALARLLLSDPDVLVLDEPTNHLDVDSVAWLENHLAEWNGALLFVSHDRDFIDAVATHIVELADGQAVEYTGGFAEFVVEREERIERVRSQAANQARKVAQVEKFVDRFRYKATKARQVQSRIKALEKLEIINVTDSKEIRARFAFPEPRRANRVVVEAHGVAAGYDGQAVLAPFDLAIERGRRFAIIGPNGAGKTTMIRTLLGEIPAVAGEVALGSNVDVARFEQHQAEVLDHSKKVHEEFRSAMPKGDTRNLRTVLGSFGFSGDAADRRVGELSGGEQTRLALAKTMATPVNLLVLDEPTNHLDLPSCDLLEDALGAYPGTVLLVTHDRHLIRNVADGLIDVRDGTVRVIDGVPDEILTRTAAQAAAASAGRSGGAAGSATKSAKGAKPAKAPRNEKGSQRNAAAAPAGARPATQAKGAGGGSAGSGSAGKAKKGAASKEQRKELNRVERAWEKAEAKVAELSARLGDPAIYADADKVKALVAEHEAAKDEAAELMEQWERLSAAAD